MTYTAHLTAGLLAERLRRDRIVDDETLRVLLNDEPATLATLEAALTATGALTERQLAALKSDMSGLPWLRETRDLELSDDLDAEVARTHGILLTAGDDPQVLLIDDSQDSVVAARAATGSGQPRLGVLTAGQHRRLWERTYSRSVAPAGATPFTFADVLDRTIHDQASDVHLKVGQPPWLRIDGAVHPSSDPPLDQTWLAAAVTSLGPDLLERVRSGHRVDTAHSHEGVRFRVHIGTDRDGITLVVRRLQDRIPTMREIGLPASAQQFTRLTQGLVLVTGPTGSGKSTTLAAMLNEVLATPRTLVTLEDPVEFLLQPKVGLVYQQEMGTDFAAFETALKATMRQDPDVILVGEMRDLETTRTAISAAETGHLVFGTLHTSSATATVARLVNQFPTEEQNQIRSQVAQSLKGVISQSLLRHRKGQGRVAAYEVMTSTPALVNNLRTPEGLKHLRNTISTGVRDGMLTMEAALVELVLNDQVTEEEAAYHARDLADFNNHLKEARLEAKRQTRV